MHSRRHKMYEQHQARITLCIWPKVLAELHSSQFIAPSRLSVQIEVSYAYVTELSAKTGIDGCRCGVGPVWLSNAAGPHLPICCHCKQVISLDMHFFLFGKVAARQNTNSCNAASDNTTRPGFNFILTFCCVRVCMYVGFPGTFDYFCGEATKNWKYFDFS